MFINITNYFFVVLGETDTNRINLMTKRMQEKGKCVQILERGFVLIVESNDMLTVSKVREDISGKESWTVLVFRLDSNSNCAWCLKEANSNYLKSVFKKIND